MSTLKRYSSYKESGVEWIGEIPEHWEVFPLKSCTKIKSEKNYPDLDLLSVYLEHGIVKFEDIDKKRTNATSVDLSEYQLAEIGDFVLNNQQAWRGSVGVSTYRGIVSPAYIVLELSDQFNSKFANYYFRNGLTVSQYLINSKGVGTIQRNLYWASLKQTYISIPPKTEQTAIASFLDTKTTQIDQAICQKEKIIELLKERRQIVINEAVTKGLKPDSPMKESGVEWIGEIPEDWKVSKLGVCLKPITIKNRTDLPLLSVAREQGVILRDVEDKESNHNFIPDDLSNYKMVKRGQFAMNKMKAWQGSYGISDYTGIVSPAYYIFELNGIEPSFFHKAIRSKVYVPFFTKASDGVRIGQWDLSKTRMKEIPFYIPSKDEQLIIVKHIEEQTTKIDTAIELQQNYIAKLKEYKATLIDSVVTGKVRVA